MARSAGERGRAGVIAVAAEAERRGIERDGGGPDAAAFWQEWMSEEIPFLLADRPLRAAQL